MEGQEYINFRQRIFEEFMALKDVRHQETELVWLHESSVTSKLKNPIDRFFFGIARFFFKAAFNYPRAKRFKARGLLENDRFKGQICSLASSMNTKTNEDELIVDVIAIALSDPGFRTEHSIPLDYELFGAVCDELSLLDIGKFCSSAIK